MAGASIGGIVSGMDTATMINQLMQIEARGQTALKGRVKTHESAVTALQSINTKMQTLLTAAKDLRKVDAWTSVKAVSSDASVTVTARPGAAAGSSTFKVMSLAKAEVETTTGKVSSTGAVIASSGKITVTKTGGEPVELAVGNGSLDAVAQAINAKTDLGIRAIAVQVEPGQYRLQLSSTKTGAASAFSVTGFDLGFETTELTAAADAVIQFGDSAVGQVKSATNTFEDVVPGTTFTVSAVDKTVTLDLSRDVEGTADKVKALVEAANAAMDEIRKHSTYDVATKRGGPLAGDSMAREMVQRVLSTVSGGAISLSGVGVEVTREGKVTFNKDKFLTALKDSPDATRTLFGQAPTYAAGATATTGAVSVLGSDPSAVAGTYDVVVTQAARKASATSTATPLPGAVYTLKRGTSVAEYTVQLGDDLAAVAEKLTAAAAAQRLGITVSATATELKAESAAYGAAGDFEMTAGGVALPGVTGLDVGGTIGGVAATGSGQTLTAPLGTAPAGVALSVTLTADDVAALAGTPVGRVSVTQGFADRLTAVADLATRRADGQLNTALEGRRSSIKTLNSQIDSWDNRLAMRRSGLERQFTSMEKALGTMRNQSNWLAGQIASMPRYS